MSDTCPTPVRHLSDSDPDTLPASVLKNLREAVSRTVALEQRRNGNLDRAILENPGSVSVILHRILAIGRTLQARQQLADDVTVVRAADVLAAPTPAEQVERGVADWVTQRRLHGQGPV